MNALGQVADWPVDRAAVGVGTIAGPGGPGGPGAGSAPPAFDTVGPVEHPFRWASLTKPATALAVMIAAEEGTLSLDDPAGPPGSTVRHLLAHASGLGPDPGPPVAPPGTARVYSNAGYLVLGDLVGARSGMSFADYLADGVLGPLGMDGTRLDGDDPAGEAAAGLSGPLCDLLRLGAELATPTLVSASSHHLLSTVSFPGLAGVLPGFQRFDPCDWGLGPEVRGDKWPHWTGTANSPATFGHFGRSGSFLWIDPVARLLCAGLCDRPFGAWAQRAWPALADEILSEARSSDGGHPPALPTNATLRSRLGSTG